MPGPVHSHAEWRPIAHALAALHRRPAPAGLVERVPGVAAQSPPGWPDHLYALELDPGSAEPVRAAHGTLVGRASLVGQRSAAIGDAGVIVRDHQGRP